VVNHGLALSDSDRILATLARQEPSLELGSTDLCFIAFLHLRGQDGQTTEFDEDQLGEAFAQTCRSLGLTADNLRGRTTHVIRRLRAQHMLVRVDGAGVTAAGRFALSRLASSIAEFFIEEDVLTRENLTLLTGTLLAKLTDVRDAASRARSSRDWKHEVEGPLRVTVCDLVRGIERRQRGLDIQQESFQSEIARLLSANWFDAIEHCQNLLESSASTLRELGAILLRDSHQLHAVLLDIGERASDPEAESVRAVLDRLIDQVDRIGAWGSVRQRSWSEYYEYVHGYLRDVVRLDPARALTQRLRNQLAAHSGRPFTLVVAAATPHRALRPIARLEPPPPVRRPVADREREPGEEKPTIDPFEALETLVRAELAGGVSGLSELTARLTERVPPEERFLLAGRIAQVLAKLIRPLSERERPWVAIDEALTIEQWRLSDKGPN